MVTMRVTAILAGLLLITVPALAQQSGYSYSCSGDYFNSGSFLNSDCQDGSGETWWTYINLDWCVTNSWGSLYCQDGGGFGGSCFDCTVGYGLLGCNCYTGNGGNYQWTAVDIDACVGNTFGDLECYNQLGVKTNVRTAKRDINATAIELREAEAVKLSE